MPVERLHYSDAQIEQLRKHIRAIIKAGQSLEAFRNAVVDSVRRDFKHDATVSRGQLVRLIRKVNAQIDQLFLEEFGV